MQTRALALSLALALALPAPLLGCQTDQSRALALLAGPGAGADDAARDALVEATRLDPTLRPAWSRLAELDLAAERWLHADSAASHAIALADTDARDHDVRARARAALGRWDEAETDLTRGLELGGSEAALRTRLGQVQEQLARPDEAIESYRRVLALDGAAHEARLSLARLLIARLEHTSAESARGSNGARDSDSAGRDEVRALLAAASPPASDGTLTAQHLALSAALAALDARAAQPPIDSPAVVVSVQHGASTENAVVMSDGPANVSITTSSRGGLAQAVVERVAQQRARSILTCYDRALESEPNLAGTLRVEATINASGSVAIAQASGLGDETFAACMSRSVRQWVFPPAPGVTQVTLSVRCGRTR